MSFLESLTPEQRRLFEASASVVELEPSEYLLRRGDPGGDLFLLSEGTLEVVESRTVPEVILSVLEPGAVVGDLAFLDDSPRSADVRAAEPCRVSRWARDDLRTLLARHPEIASVFYRHVAHTTANRIRSLTHSAVAQGRADHEARMNTAGFARIREECRRITEAAKESFLQVENRLRHSPNHAPTRERVGELLDWLSQELHHLREVHPEVDAIETARKLLGRELHPYLVRSALAERCIRRPQGVCGSPEILAHVLLNNAHGDGQLGELIDRWLLDRPLLRAIRTGRKPMLDAVQKALPSHRNRRVLLLNAGTGSLVAHMLKLFGDLPTVLTVVDPSKEALAFLDRGSALGVDRVQIQPLQERLASFATRRLRRPLAAQDAVVLHGVIEYMPERIAISLLRAIRQLLAPNGVVAVQALTPSIDRDLFELLLNWPLLPRHAEAVDRLLTAANLPAHQRLPLEPPALVALGQPAPTVQAAPNRDGSAPSGPATSAAR